ncbi:unnamed protein product [Bathycoccus prasinos]
MVPERGEGAYRHWPDDHPVVGNLLRIKRDEFRDAGMLPPLILNVALDLLRYFFFLEQSGQLARRGSTRIPWKELTAVLQKAFPDSRLAQLELTKATAAVTDREKTVLHSTGGCLNERDRLGELFPPLAFWRVPSNECVTDAMLDALLAKLTPSTPAPEVRPQVVRSLISSRGAPRSHVVRSPILPPMALPPPRYLHTHPNPPTSPPPPSTTRAARRRRIVASTPPNATLVTPLVTTVETDPVAIGPEAVAGLATVVAEEGDDEPGVQFESEADEGIAEDDAAVPVMSAAPVPASVAMAVAAVVPALEEAGDPGARLVANAGEEVRAEPGVRMEANVGGEVAAEGTVAANVVSVVEVPSGDDAFALLEEREIRLENVELEGGAGLGFGDQPTPEEIFEMLVAEELNATSEEDKLRARLKRHGIDPDLLSNPFTTKALDDLAGVKALFASEENVKPFENRISVLRQLDRKTEVTLNHYFREIFHALVCGKIAVDVAYSLTETLIGAFAFLSRKVLSGRVRRSNDATIKKWHRYLAQRKTVSVLMEYKAIMEA